MANTRVKSLFVLTLLQLCRAEIADKLPEWYSANVINDGFQPKSISEIFSTESPFSSTNPIVVLPKSTSMPDKVLSSSLLPSSFSEDFTKTSILPLPSSTPLPPTISTIPPQISTEFSSRFPSQPPQVEITQFTEQTPPPAQTLFDIQQEKRQTTLSTSIPPSTLEQQTALLQAPQSIATGRFLLPAQNVPELLTTQEQSYSSTPAPLPNYFVIYQQAPSGQGFPGQEPSLQGGLFGVAVPQQGSTTRLPGSTVVIQPSSSTTTSPPSTRITSNSPPQTTLTPTSGRPTTREPTSQRPTSQRPTSQGLTTRVTIGGSTTLIPATQPNRNCLNGTQFPSIGGLPVRIRVVGPRGSITHVNINPPATVTSTTTKRPTTTRTRKTPKPKKNTYEACLNGCKVRREPICAIPLSATWIDPEQLKGFPSICHMACFNSYKKEPYEKLLDGRCGRLRTRIQTFDSKTKLKREELNKAQYFVDSGDQTIVEVSPLRHK